MVEYVLGNYMMSKDMLTREKFEEVIQRLDKVRVKLGLIAVSEGYMTQEQAEKINQIQSTCDMRFGEIAVKNGYLTQEQLDRIVRFQPNSFLVFVQCLIDEGVLRIGQINEVLEQFCREKDFGVSDIRAFKEDNVDRIVALYVPREVAEFTDIIQIAVRMMQRCIDRYIYIDSVEVVEKNTANFMVSQCIEGNVSVTTAVSEDIGGMLYMAGVYAMEDFESLDEDALDAAGEFLNCINGIYTSEVSGLMELKPPKYQAIGGELRGKVTCRVPIVFGNAKMYFWVSR